MAVSVRISKPKLDQLLHGRTGPVVLHQANVGREVAGVARRTAPRGKGSGPHLADHIKSELVSYRGAWAVNIVADRPYAFYVHNGTNPHSIGSPVNMPGIGWRYIGLSPRGAGKIHPGTRANPFLLRAAEQLGLTVRRVN